MLITRVISNSPSCPFKCQPSDSPTAPPLGKVEWISWGTIPTCPCLSTEISILPRRWWWNSNSLWVASFHRRMKISLPCSIPSNHSSTWLLNSEEEVISNSFLNKMLEVYTSFLYSHCKSNQWVAILWIFKLLEVLRDSKAWSKHLNTICTITINHSIKYPVINRSHFFLTKKITYPPIR